MTFRESFKPKLCLPLATTATDRTGATIDVRGYLGVVIVLHNGVNAAAATGTYKIQASGDGTTWFDLDVVTITIAAVATDRAAVWDIARPRHRYVRIVKTATNGETTTESALAYLYRASSEPVPATNGIDPVVNLYHAPDAA